VASGREQYLQALASLSDLTRTQAERVAGLLAKQGEVQSAQVGRVAEDLLRRTQKNREIMSRLVQREVKRQLGVLGMATRDEVARLQQRVRALEQELERSSRPAPASAAGVAEPGPAPAARPSRAASTPTSSTTSSAAKPATRAKAATAKPATRAKAATSKSGSGKPSTRTRTGGSSSRSTASSPGTRRTRSSGKSTPPGSGTPK
jgi:polyhydroxyalkanoate synthesis regulator phasin